jgi:D-alanine-D-alanine ligase
MRVAVVYNAVADKSRLDESDVLIQVNAVAQALKQLGHRVALLACSLNLSAAQNQLQKIQPDIVFNLVEGLNGQDRLVHLLPAFLDSMGIPYTGAQSEALHFTSNKILAKQWMVAADLPTPPWLGPYPPEGPFLSKHLEAAGVTYGAQAGVRWLIKSLWQHASCGLHEDELILGENVDQTRALLPTYAAQLGGACFAEAFIDGREFNLSLLAESRTTHIADGLDFTARGDKRQGSEVSQSLGVKPDALQPVCKTQLCGPQVLPPAEIIFEDYPDDKLHIVGYRAKWEKDSYEYNHTPRCFDFPPQDATLLMRLEQMAKKCWQVFGLGGYARIDFRVDADGQPWILEINANPCLSPDAGFAAAVKQSGLTFAEAVGRILSDATAADTTPC